MFPGLRKPREMWHLQTPQASSAAVCKASRRTRAHGGIGRAVHFSWERKRCRRLRSARRTRPCAHQGRGDRAHGAGVIKGLLCGKVGMGRVGATQPPRGTTPAGSEASAAGSCNDCCSSMCCTASRDVSYSDPLAFMDLPPFSTLPHKNAKNTRILKQRGDAACATVHLLQGSWLSIDSWSMHRSVRMSSTLTILAGYGRHASASRMRSC